MNNLFSSIEDMKSHLIKYCYLNNRNALRESLVSMIKSCDNYTLISYIYKFFEMTIFPFYFSKRTQFNKLRSMFMLQVMKSIGNYFRGSTLEEAIEPFTKDYIKWCRLSFISSGEANLLLEKFNLLITDITECS